MMIYVHKEKFLDFYILNYASQEASIGCIYT